MKGGHWEHILFGDGPSAFKLWIHVDHCTVKHPEHRLFYSKGTPTCEDYTNVETK
jgi:hypothetical protein